MCSETALALASLAVMVNNKFNLDRLETESIYIHGHPVVLPKVQMHYYF
jgi:hypothetical protein